MSVEAITGIAVAIAGLISACVSIGVILGVQKAKVDRLERDVNEAFRMIRQVNNSRGEEK